MPKDENIKQRGTSMGLIHLFYNYAIGITMESHGMWDVGCGMWDVGCGIEFMWATNCQKDDVLWCQKDDVL